MNTHHVRFVWLNVQLDTEWNSHGNIPTYGDYFSGIFPGSREKVNNGV